VVAVATWQVYVHQVKSGAEFSRPAYSYQRAAYQFYNVGYIENMSYVDPFRPELGLARRRDLVDRLGTNLQAIPTALGEAATLQRGWYVGEVARVRERFPALTPPDWMISATVWVLSAMVLGGLVLLARAGHWLPVVYVAGSIALIVVTPWPAQFSRYLVPLAPILALAFVWAPAEAARRAGESNARGWRAASLVGHTMIAFVLVQEVYTVYKLFTKHHQPAEMTDEGGNIHHYRLFFYDLPWRLHDEGLDWLGRQKSHQAIIATSTPHLAYLRTGMRAVMPPYEIDSVKAAELLDGIPVTYLVVDQLSFLDVSRRYAAPVPRAATAQWPQVYAMSDSGPRIYRRAAVDAAPSIGSK
jgi:hypothetical protein